MIGSISSNFSFTGLPQYLQRAKVDSLNSRGLSDIIKDAGEKAGYVVRTSSGKVFKNNSKLFDEAGKITKEGVDLLSKEYDLTKGTCTELRDNLAKMYKKYPDGIFDVLV